MSTHTWWYALGAAVFVAAHLFAFSLMRIADRSDVRMAELVRIEVARRATAAAVEVARLAAAKGAG